MYREVARTNLRILGPEHSQTVHALYNLACYLAVEGDRQGAMDRLARAVAGGFRRADFMVQDADLTSLHGPEFDALVERARSNAGPKAEG